MSAQEIRVKAQRMEAENRWDSAIGLVIVLVLTVIAVIGLLALQRLEPAARIIIAIVLLLAWGGAWYNHRRRPRSLPIDADLAASLRFYRNELQRRHDYFARPPWLLIVVVIFAALQFLVLVRQWNPSMMLMMRAPAAMIVCVVIFIPLWRGQARKFRRELDALKQFEENE